MSRVIAALFLLVATALPSGAFAEPCKYFNKMQVGLRPDGSPIGPYWPGNPADEVRGPFTMLISTPTSILNIDPRAGDGTQVATMRVSTSDFLDATGAPSPGAVMVCDHPIEGIISDMLAPASTYPSIPKIYETGVDDIVMTFGPEGGYDFPTVWGAPAGSAGSVPQFMAYTSPTNYFVLRFYKVGPIGRGGVAPRMFSSQTLIAGHQPYINIGFKDPIIVVPRVPTCDVTTPDVQVPLDAEEVASFTSVGMTRGEKDFKVSLACSGGDAGTTTEVNMSLADQTTPGNASQNLSLTSASTATGVGVQILRNGTAISFNPATNKFKVQDVLPGNSTVDIPFKARYVRTGAMTPGIVQGIATFTMEYK